MIILLCFYTIHLKPIFLFVVCTKVVHKRCHESVVTACLGHKDEALELVSYIIT